MKQTRLMLAVGFGLLCSTAGVAVAADLAPTPKEFLVPQAPSPMTIDAKLDDWAGVRSVTIDPTAEGKVPGIKRMETDPGKPIRGAKDISGQVWLAWDATNLYIAGQVRDDDLNGFRPDVAHNQGPAGWFGDSVMFQFQSFRQRIKSNSPFEPTPMLILRYRVHPGARGRLSTAGWQKHDQVTKYWKLPKGSQLASRETPDGYIVEASVPWRTLNFKAQAGEMIFGGFLLTDIDKNERLNQLGWQWQPNAMDAQVMRLLGRPEATGLLTLATDIAKAGAPFSVSYRIDARAADVANPTVRLVHRDGTGKTKTVELNIPKGQTGRGVVQFDRLPKATGQAHVTLKAVIAGKAVTLAEEAFTIVAARSTPRAELKKAEPLLDWSAWAKYRHSVKHPATMLKASDLARARENVKRYEWAREHVKRTRTNADAVLKQLTPAFVRAMIPATTPGEILYTPCPVCRERGKRYHTHGQWTWSVSKPDQLTCRICKTVFPNDAHPESLAIKTTWGRSQTHTYYGGKPFKLFSYLHGRPSFTGNIRARKAHHMGRMVGVLAEAHAVSPDTRYAEAIRLMLLRFAEVYPYWLVHSGYGEIADMDPHTAALHINNLPEPEKVLPPDRPDRRLHTGYWTAGRARAVGMESGFVGGMTAAYDLTCTAKRADGSPVYSDAERQTIEKDLLLEGAVLLLADKGINNKSVGGRTTVAVVGMCVGHPGLVRFGLDGFSKTVDGWFLPDGYTPESIQYALMTLRGTIQMGQAFRGYSDPPGYTDADGKRLDGFDLYHDTHYRLVWQAMHHMLQGDLTYPLFADSHASGGLGVVYAELMTANYPDRPEYLALLKELAGPDLSKGAGVVAILHREPGLESKPSPPVSLPDVCPPELRIGFMRTGMHGRQSLLLLSASHFGSHHHLDSLNLYYWKQGRQLLTDLGYLWDHPRKFNLKRTVAHNLVLLDGEDQVRKGRGGDVEFFAAGKRVKAMLARSKAYKQAKLYRRLSGSVDHGERGSYVFDAFYVAGGKTQDFVFHGPHKNYRMHGLDLKPCAEKLYDFANVRTAAPAGLWRATWTMDKAMHFTAWSVGHPSQRVFVADGWGQRNYGGSDEGVTIPYVVRRTAGPGAHTFLTVFEGHKPDSPVVRDVTHAAPSPGVDVLTVRTSIGQDVIVLSPDRRGVSVATSAGAFQVDARLAVISVQNGRAAWTFAEGDGTVKKR